MSERSVRNWRKGPLPSEKKKDSRRQRTRPDPLAGVWEQDIEPLLRADVEGVLSAPTILEWLEALGWATTYGPDIGPDAQSSERPDYDQVVLEQRLLDALADLNPNLPSIAVNGGAIMSLEGGSTA